MYAVHQLTFSLWHTVADAVQFTHTHQYTQNTPEYSIAS